MKNGKRIPLCDASSVAPGCALRAESEGCVYAVFNVDGALYVTQDECTHGPGALSEGYILDDEVECPFHQGRFDVRDGRALGAPVVVGLKTFPVKIENGNIYVQVTREATDVAVMPSRPPASRVLIPSTAVSQKACQVDSSTVGRTWSAAQLNNCCRYSRRHSSSSSSCAAGSC
jgi:nitrite reductase/ring-hydroxylating ferredoxin subunit